MINQVVSAKFAIITTCLLLYTVFLNQPVTGLIIVTDLKLRFSLLTFLSML